MERKIVFTTRHFERSHGRKPSPSTMGSWAFRKATAESAYSHQLEGEIRFFHGGTLAEAKKALREVGETGIWAVMP